VKANAAANAKRMLPESSSHDRRPDTAAQLKIVTHRRSEKIAAARNTLAVGSLIHRILAVK
jgi:hypothetical protein